MAHITDDMMIENVYIIIVNWNGWRDTVECLESVFRMDYKSFKVVVCDNDSRDSSLNNIEDWANGRFILDPIQGHPLHALSSPPVQKPVTLKRYLQHEAEQSSAPRDNERLILIRNERNLGFAGGNNVGLRYALAHADLSYAWLLNNDTVVQKDALTCLVRRMHERSDAGMCGSTIPYYSDPDRIWALGGGAYNKWIARSRSIGYLQSMRQSIPRDKIEAKIDYIVGASMLVSRAFLEDIGLVNEDYFLYYEEYDWALRARRKYKLAYAHDSIVYHKAGASTETVFKKGLTRNSPIWHEMRSHLRFTRRFFPLLLPVVVIRRGIQALLLLAKAGAVRFFDLFEIK